MHTNENLLPLCEAVQQATAHRPHLSTVMRWCLSGSQGIQLESKMLGGKRLTSIEAVQRFVEARTRASTPNHASNAPRTSRERMSDVERAEKALEKMGVK